MQRCWAKTPQQLNFSASNVATTTAKNRLYWEMNPTMQIFVFAASSFNVNCNLQQRLRIMRSSIVPNPSSASAQASSNTKS
eukprot:1021066-Amphidinium_carterae.3